MVTGELALMSDTQTVDLFCKTTDNWRGSYQLQDGYYQLNLVMVSFYRLEDEWIVSCWGNDDMGLEKNFQDKTDAWACFQQIIGFSDVTQEKCRELGLYPA
jgi:hypothetical protein